MSKSIKVMLVVAICSLAVAAFAQNQLPSTNNTQTPTYDNGATTPTGGVSKWGTTPTAGTATTMDSTGYNFTAGQQFNSKWQMVNGNHDLTTNATKGGSWSGGTGIVGGAAGSVTVKSSALCGFCHTAHDNESEFADRTFLWAHDVPSSYSAYASPTLQSNPNTTATSQTAQCLGCHDGSVAVSSGAYGTPIVASDGTSADYNINNQALTVGGKISASQTGGGALLVPLSRTHPVSFTYDSTLAAKHQLRVPANSKSVDGFGIVPLFGTTGTMECATCHDPHIKAGIMRRQFPTGASQDAGTGSFCMYCHL